MVLLRDLAHRTFSAWERVAPRQHAWRTAHAALVSSGSALGSTRHIPSEAEAIRVRFLASF